MFLREGTKGKGCAEKYISPTTVKRLKILINFHFFSVNYLPLKCKREIVGYGYSITKAPESFPGQSLPLLHAAYAGLCYTSPLTTVGGSNRFRHGFKTRKKKKKKG